MSPVDVNASTWSLFFNGDFTVSVQQVNNITTVVLHTINVTVVVRPTPSCALVRLWRAPLTHIPFHAWDRMRCSPLHHG